VDPALLQREDPGAGAGSTPRRRPRRQSWATRFQDSPGLVPRKTPGHVREAPDPRRDLSAATRHSVAAPGGAKTPPAYAPRPQDSPFLDRAREPSSSTGSSTRRDHQLVEGHGVSRVRMVLVRPSNRALPGCLSRSWQGHLLAPTVISSPTEGPQLPRSRRTGPAELTEYAVSPSHPYARLS
jgi:hypothetical protein